MITIGTTGYDTQPQIDFCIGKSNHLYPCFSRIFAKITILSHIGNSTLKKNKNFIEEKIYYNFTDIIEKQKQMKKRTLTAGTILLCLSAISFGQNSIKDFLHQNPQFFGSTASVYYCNDTTDTPAPKDFIPFHIDHIARHGSRTHDSKSMVPNLYKLMNKADSLNLLTREGKLLRNQILWHNRPRFHAPWLVWRHSSQK